MKFDNFCNVSERNLNPKAACLKRREEEKAEDGPNKLGAPLQQLPLSHPHPHSHPLPYTTMPVRIRLYFFRIKVCLNFK